MKAHRHSGVKKAILIVVLLMVVVSGTGLLTYKPAYRYYRSSIARCAEWGNSFRISDQHLTSLLDMASQTAGSTSLPSARSSLARIRKEQKEDRIRADQSGINRPGGCDARQLPNRRFATAEKLANLTARSEQRISSLHNLSLGGMTDPSKVVSSSVNRKRLAAILPGLEDLLTDSTMMIGATDPTLRQLTTDLDETKREMTDQTGIIDFPKAEATLYRDADQIIKAQNRSRGIDCQRQPCIALTFDDGPNSLTTSGLINTLFATKTRATFFPIGQKVTPLTAPLLNRLSRSGYPIGNHTWSHQDLPDIMARHEEGRELEESGRTIQSASQRSVTMIRPPHGRIDEASRTYIGDNLGSAIVVYNVDSYDWAQGATASSVSTKIRSVLEPGSIVLMHDSQPHTGQALPKLIQDLKDEGYLLVTIPELTGEYPRAGTVYYSRTNILRP